MTQQSRYYHRAVDAFLIEWKNDSQRKPLLLRGARQVGKSIHGFVGTNLVQGLNAKHLWVVNYSKNHSFKCFTTRSTSSHSITGLIGKLSTSL